MESHTVSTMGAPANPMYFAWEVQKSLAEIQKESLRHRHTLYQVQWGGFNSRLKKPYQKAALRMCQLALALLWSHLFWWKLWVQGKLPLNGVAAQRRMTSTHIPTLSSWSMMKREAAEPTCSLQSLWQTVTGNGTSIWLMMISKFKTRVRGW